MDVFLQDYKPPTTEETVGTITKPMIPTPSASILTHDQAIEISEQRIRSTTKVSIPQITTIQTPYSNKFLTRIARTLNVEPDIALEKFKGWQLTLPPNPDIKNSHKTFIKNLMSRIKSRYIKEIKGDRPRISTRKTKIYAVNDMDLSKINEDIKWFYKYVREIYDDDVILSVPPNDIYIHLLHTAIQLAEIKSTSLTEVSLLSDVRNALQITEE